MADLFPEVKCVMCHKRVVIKVDREGYYMWRAGEKIQDVLPDVSVDDREVLITELCKECWTDAFGISEAEASGTLGSGSVAGADGK